jgi:hypothetical protein
MERLAEAQCSTSMLTPFRDVDEPGDLAYLQSLPQLTRCTASV